MSLQKIFSFSKWRKVLDQLHLKPAVLEHKAAVKKAVNLGGGGESEQHKKLKNYIADHPEVLKLPSKLRGIIEYALPSGDTVDVLFENSDDVIGVEVKSALSVESDIVRGIFQCVKYRAVINAYLASKGLPQNGRAVLIIEAALPKYLSPLKNMLSVEVLDKVKP